MKYLLLFSFPVTKNSISQRLILALFFEKVIYKALPLEALLLSNRGEQRRSGCRAVPGPVPCLLGVAAAGAGHPSIQHQHSSTRTSQAGERHWRPSQVGKGHVATLPYNTSTAVLAPLKLEGGTGGPVR
jgi:hypothetical protein